MTLLSHRSTCTLASIYTASDPPRSYRKNCQTTVSWYSFWSLLVVVFVAWISSSTLASAAGVDVSTYFDGQDVDPYVNWVTHTLHDQYPSTAFIASASDPTLGAALHWKIHDDSKVGEEPYVELAVAVKASGWLGFGLSINGGMTGSDMVIVEAQQPSVAKDAYVTDVRQPILDDCQDWTIHNMTIDEPYMMVQLSRKLNTGDASQDLIIRNDSNVASPSSRVIAAWGDETTFQYHGPANRARGALRWYSDGQLEQQNFDVQMQQQADGKFFVGASNHLIPSNNQTEYAYFCFTKQDLIDQGVDMDRGVTVIAFDPVINNTKHVHHFDLFALYQDLPNNMTCDAKVKAIGAMAYLWAPGEPPLSLPDNVGFEVGGTSNTTASSSFQSFVLEIHYDNAALESDQYDSSGVELYYTTTPRQYAAGVLVVGDARVALAGVAIDRGLSDYTFNCPGTCSAIAQVDQPVTVLREHIHMHKSGYSAYTDQLRNGTLVRRASIEYFDFAQSGGPGVPIDPFEVLPGDAFSMKCFYNNDNTTRKFGPGSDDEMCMGFMLYYPRRTISLATDIEIPWMCGVGFASFGLFACDTQWTSQVLDNPALLNRTFGSNLTHTCDATDETNSGSGSGSGSGSATNDSSTSFPITTTPTAMAVVVVVTLAHLLLL